MEKITVRLPIVYKAEVRNGRESKFREKWFGEFVDFEIRQVDQIEAPVAAEWIEHHIDTTTEHSIVLVDGHFYQPRSSSHQDEQASIDIFFSESALRLGHAPTTGLFSRANLASERHAFMEFMNGKLPGSLVEQKEYIRDTRVDALSKVEAALNELVIIDGMIWSKCPEPVLRLSVETARRCLVTYSMESSYAPDAHGHYFRLTEWDAMVDFGKILAPEEMHQDRLVLYDVGDVRVHIPEAFTALTDLDALMNFAGRVLRTTKSNILDHGREATTFWHDVNEQLLEVSNTRRDADIDLLMTVTERLVKKIERLDTSHYSRVCSAMKDRIANRAVTTASHKLDV